MSNKNIIPGAWFQLASNFNNELWSIGMSQLKLANVASQQAGVAVMNGFQKHQQSQKEQLGIMEELLGQFRTNQQKGLDIAKDTIAETVDKFRKVSEDFKPKA